MGKQMERLSQMLANRCFFLFLALLGLLLATPFLTEITYGMKLIGLLNVLILITAVAAIQRSKLSFVVASLLGLPTLAFQILSSQSGAPEHLALSWGFGAAFYAFTIAHLLQYVLRRDVMTADKLYGAVAAYIMIAIMWAFLYSVLQYFNPNAYLHLGAPKYLGLTSDLIYFSFMVLTNTGLGDITPAVIYARYLVMLESVTGVMYVAILIARLTGVYPVHGRST
ncbi:MAG: hypothetical protein RLZZ298_232 [Pseudomonadota bacterium]|jgi:hypothetical protein